MLYRNDEKREYPRHSYGEGPAAPSVTIYARNSATPIYAPMRDISKGGIGVRGEYRVKKNEVVRCSLNFPGIPVLIPTLMRVRWSRKISPGYMIGLQFLI